MSVKSLRAKITATCLGGMALLATSASFMFFKAQEEQRYQIKHAMEEKAIELGKAIGAQFFERYGDIQAFGKNSALYGEDTAAMESAFNDYTRLYQIYDLIVFVNPRGELIASNTVDAKGDPLDTSALNDFNFATTPWFREVLAGRFTEDHKKGFSGTFVEDVGQDVMAGKVYKSPRYTNGFSTRITDREGRLVGILSARANFVWVEYEFQSLYKGLKSQNLGSAELTLLNKSGEVIVDYDPTKNGGSTEVKRDYNNVLGKLNLVKLGVGAAMDAVSGRAGANISLHARKQIVQVGGYTPVTGDKFIDSLGWSVLVRIARDEVFATLDQAQQTYYIFVAITLLVVSLFSFWFSRTIASKLNHISDNITSTANTVGEASNQLSSASQQLSGSATEAAASLQETVASLEELTSMVTLNASNASEAANLAQKSSEVAKNGESEVKSLIESITEIAASSQKIEEIINVIDDIAFQTNLLALNAAVEAARAGEQGKGFAVVAEAVRNLAQRSATAAKEINTLIKENVSRIDRGTTTADKSGAVLQEILTSVKKVSDLNNEIAAASKEQSTGLTQISTAMNELDSSTQDNAASSDQVASSSEELNSQAESLRSLVNNLNTIITGGQTLETGTAPQPDLRHNLKLLKGKKKKNTSKNTAPQDALPLDESEEKELDTTVGF